jgi:hypothetical protein
VVLHQRQLSCPAPRVEYRYLPRDLDQFMRELPAASVVHARMFSDEDVRRTSG